MVTTYQPGRIPHLGLVVLLIVIAAGLLSARVKGDDSKDRERRAIAAWHMTGPAVSAAAQACTCEEGTRGPFNQQFARILGERRVMVAFFGQEPRCCKGTLIGVASQVPVGYNAARPIVVYYPMDGYRIGISETLPADASNAELTRAVKSAQAKVTGRPK